jgi:hypothetical protein
MTNEQTKIYTIYVGNPGGSLVTRTASGLRNANRIAKDESVRAGHARVALDHVTISEWHLGIKQEKR